MGPLCLVPTRLYTAAALQGEQATFPRCRTTWMVCWTCHKLIPLKILCISTDSHINCWCYTSTKGSGGRGGHSLYIRDFFKNQSKEKKTQSHQKLLSAFILENEIFTGDSFGPLSPIIIFFLRSNNTLYKSYRIISSNNFNPSASSKVHYENIFMLAERVGRHSRNGLLTLQRFHDHIQELAQFGAHLTKQPSKCITNIKLILNISSYT